MRRKARSLLRWRKRKAATHEKAARAFIRGFERKFFGGGDPHQLTWARWYFPLINTDESLRLIDRYMQDCIRYIATEKRTKQRFDFTYGQMKELGCFSLVHMWRRQRAGGAEAAGSESAGEPEGLDGVPPLEDL